MGLNKAKGNMYPWVTHTHCHLAGRCPHRCSYCYVQALERRFQSGRYAGTLRLERAELAVNYGEGKTIFVEHCNDLFAEAVPSEWVDAILTHCWLYPDNTYVFQTKDPKRMANWVGFMPSNRLLGVTLETDSPTISGLVSEHAPDAAYRMAGVRGLRAVFGEERLFVSVEPVLAMNDPAIFAADLADLRPEFVSIGADSKGGGLPEPPAGDVTQLIACLSRHGVDVRCKDNLSRLTLAGDE